MQLVVRSACRPDSPLFTHFVTRYRTLQAELAALVADTKTPYPAETMVQHALAGSIKVHDAVILAQLVEAQAPARMLEIGSFLGFSTRWLLEASRSMESILVAIDPGIRHRIFDRPTDILRRFNADFLGFRLTTRCGFFSERMSGGWYYDYEHYEPHLDRAEVDAIFNSRPLLTHENLGEGMFDFIFIDGDHSEKGVLTNFAEALPLLSPGGCIAFHDALTWPDVGRALASIADSYATIGEVEILGQGIPAPSCDGVGVFWRRDGSS